MPRAIRTVSAGKIGRVLRAMADKIEQHGHFQGGTWTGERCCLVFNPAFVNAGIGVRKAVIRTIAPAANYSITSWNDHTPTVEVLRVLRQMADDLERGVDERESA